MVTSLRIARACDAAREAGAEVALPAIFGLFWGRGNGELGGFLVDFWLVSQF